MKCFICGITDKLERHRIVPNGKYTEENIILLCKLHHNQLHNWIRDKWGNDYKSKELGYEDFITLIIKFKAKYIESS